MNMTGKFSNILVNDELTVVKGEVEIVSSGMDGGGIINLDSVVSVIDDLIDKITTGKIDDATIQDITGKLDNIVLEDPSLQEEYDDIKKLLDEISVTASTGNTVDNAKINELANKLAALKEQIKAGSVCSFDAGGKYFLAPNAKVFQLPPKAKVLLNTSVYKDGVVYGFYIDKKSYVADAQLIGGINSFNGYKNAETVYPLVYETKAALLHVLFSEKPAVKIYTVNSYESPLDAKNDNLDGVQNNNHIQENKKGFDEKKLVFTCSGAGTEKPTDGADGVFTKLKNKNVKSSTFIYQDKTLIKLTPGKPAEKIDFSESQLAQLKSQLQAGEFSGDAAVLFEKTSSGYKTTVAFNKGLQAKYGNSSDVKQQCAKLLEERTTTYLKTAKDLTSTATMADDGTFTDGKKFEFGIDQSVCEVIVNVVHDASTFIQNAQIPAAYYDSKDGAYGNNWIHAPPLPTGVANGVIEEIKDIPVLVAFGADIAMNPKTRHELKEGLKKLGSWEGIKTAAKGAVTGWTDKYSNGGDQAWHQAGKDAVAIYSIGKAASALVGAFKDGVEKEAEEIAESVVAKKVGKIFTVAELKLLKRAELPKFVQENLDDLLSDANRQVIWELTDEASGQFKRGDLIEEIFNQWGSKYKNYQNLNEIIPNYKTLDFDGVLNNVNEVVSLKTYHPKSATEKTLSGITAKIEDYSAKLSSATLDASHSGKKRVLDFTIKKGEWDGFMDDILDRVDDLKTKYPNVTIMITEF